MPSMFRAGVGIISGYSAMPYVMWSPSISKTVPLGSLPSGAAMNASSVVATMYVSSRTDTFLSTSVGCQYCRPRRPRVQVSQPALRAMRMASMRLRAPVLLMALDR